MKEEYARVLGFKKNNPTINLALKKQDERRYDLGVIAIHLVELKDGFIVKRMNKPNKDGLMVTYKALETTKEYDEYKEKIENLIKTHMEKYKENYKEENIKAVDE